MSSNQSMEASLARLEEWARHSEKLAQKAEEDRAEMMKQLQELAKTQQDFAETQKTLVKDMAEVKPITTIFMSFRSKLLGAGILLGIIGGLVTFILTYFKEAFLKLLSGV